ncbi:hypothetical protein [Salinarimonas soli]|uniref:Uncharacterized protein n=1 Tax=Salinarimonas soli TaxID=1638099 RepID=A0A5B2VF00_9HYPH|nr:hypothetical protein [Salinarimonas soli]KAA2236962.1 hypothetical protein F0L46_11865 [Salinarimonas soli]
MDLGWVDVLKLAATTGIITAVLTQGFTWLRERLTAAEKKRDVAGYLAMRLAVTLEAYASACQDLIAKNDNAEHLPDEQYPEWSVRLPELPPYPDDSDGWRALNRRLAARALEFRNRVAETQALIFGVLEYDEDDADDLVAEHACERGLEAYRLAVDLRKASGLDRAELVWNFPDLLEQKLVETRAVVAQRERERAETSARWAAERASQGEALATALAEREKFGTRSLPEVLEEIEQLRGSDDRR